MSGLELRKKYCFMKKIDNNPMLCSKSEYDHDMILSGLV